MAHHALTGYYGTPAPNAGASVAPPAGDGGRPPHPAKNLVWEIIETIVAQNTSRPNRLKAMANLRLRFPDPALIAEANLIDVLDAIYVAGLANLKAPRLQALVVHLLDKTEGTLALDWLYDAPLDEAYTFLRDLPGVGPLTASLILLFDLGRPILPVNTGLHRVAQRVGMVPKGISPERAAPLMQAALPDEAIYPFHVNMVRHARAICVAQRPKCEQCVLAAFCDFAHYGGQISD